MPEEILILDNISKRYGTGDVLRGVSLTAKRGHCMALTGRNGSGKSTLLRIAAGLTRATSGTVRQNGRVRVQYIPEAFPPLSISAHSLLSTLGKAEGIPGPALEARIRSLLVEFDLEKESGKPMRAYSKGMLQKVAVIQAFLSQPDLLLLDEPLSGQDAPAQAAFVRHAQALRDSGTAIILACHEQHLIADLASSVYRLRDGTLAEITLPEEGGRDHYTFALPDGFARMPARPGMQTEYAGGRLFAAVAHGTGDRMLQEMLDAGCRLEEMRHEKNI
jgi:ABC-2 type transport system ATP-binding protein